jgi:hypothetical protein
MNDEKHESRIFDVNAQIAYLIAQKRFPLRYVPIKDEGKIKFSLSGEGLHVAVHNFFANDSIPVQDYLAAFNTIKNIVLAMKDSGK